MNKYFFHHRGQNIAIFAQDLPDAFIPWKRFFGKFSATQEEFEKDLIDPVDMSQCCILTGNSLSTEEIRNLVLKHKIPAMTVVHKKEKVEPKENVNPLEKSVEIVSEETPIKRGRGRPKGIKNKIPDTTSIEQYFEE